MSKASFKRVMAANKLSIYHTVEKTKEGNKVHTRVKPVGYNAKLMWAL